MAQSAEEVEVLPQDLVIGKKYIRIPVAHPEHRAGPTKLLGRPTPDTVEFDAGYGATVTAKANYFRYLEEPGIGMAAPGKSSSKSSQSAGTKRRKSKKSKHRNNKKTSKKSRR